MKSQPISIKRRQFLESILKHEVHADEMQKYENMVKPNDLARVADILEKGAVNRRDFLKSGRLAALLGGIAAVSNNCAGGSLMLGGVKETGPVHYPRLPGHKIQSPEHYGLEGCMVGYFSGETHGTSRPSLAEKLNKKEIEEIIEKYKNKLNKYPAVIFMGYMWSRLAEPGNEFPIGQAIGAAEKGIIPFITYDLRMLFLGRI